MTMGRDYVFELRPWTGVLLTPDMLNVYGEPRWNDVDRGKLGEKSIPVLLCSPQIPHGLTRARTRSSPATVRRLNAWAMARTWFMLQENMENGIQGVKNLEAKAEITCQICYDLRIVLMCYCYTRTQCFETILVTFYNPVSILEESCHYV
jgi:hypothetical protein